MNASVVPPTVARGPETSTSARAEMPTILASAVASGVAIAVIVSEPALTVLLLPTKARVLPVTFASGCSSATDRPPPDAPPA